MKQSDEDVQQATGPSAWSARVDRWVARADSDQKLFRQANKVMVERALDGRPRDGVSRNQAYGLRAVINVAAAHVPDVLRNGYRNCYDNKLVPIGSKPARVSRTRERIDGVIAQLVPGSSKEQLYFAAVELNGSGVRFYGDVCLVVRPSEFDEDAVVLDRNSYDLARPPLAPKDGKDVDELLRKAHTIAGTRADVPAMATLKIFDGSGDRGRLVTVGQVSQGMVEDEDYIEVPLARPGNRLSARHFERGRLSAADVALDARIADEAANGPTPDLVDLLWRERRRRAAKALREEGVPLSTVVSQGRLR